MLHYVIVFCTISLCYSQESITGEYHELILTQRSPIAAYLQLEQALRMLEMNDRELNSYFVEYEHKALISVPSDRWIINSLAPRLVNDTWPVNCVNKTGHHITYQDNPLPSEIKEKLALYWPSAVQEATEEEIWSAAYDVHGNCIKTKPEYYFKDVMNLMDNYEVGQIFRDKGIGTNDRYDIGYLKAVIKNKLKVTPHLRCLHIPGDDERDQYLFEVQLCFNTEQLLINCHHSVRQNCNPFRAIYAEWKKH